MTQRYRVFCAYDGSAYHGWQKQENGLSIQEVIEKAMKKIHKRETRITASGRTDAGVHALGQVFHFDADGRIGEYGYEQALNTLLPKDIRVLRVEKTDPDFHARFSAKSKCYEYVLTREKNNPFIYRYKTPVRNSLDLQKMKEAADVLIGRHDFTSFTHAKLPKNKSRIKTLRSIEFIEDNQDIRIRFEGDGFLRYQVRMMSAVLIRAGEGKLETDEIKEMLEARDKEAVRFNAPPEGLYLLSVGYVEKSAKPDSEEEAESNSIL